MIHVAKNGLLISGKLIAGAVARSGTESSNPALSSSESAANPANRSHAGQKPNLPGAHDALLARLGLQIGMLCGKLSNLRFDRLGQQRTRAAAQDLCQGMGKRPGWANLITLLWDTAYHSLIGEVEALNTTTIRRYSLASLLSELAAYGDYPTRTFPPRVEQPQHREGHRQLGICRFTESAMG